MARSPYPLRPDVKRRRKQQKRADTVRDRAVSIVADLIRQGIKLTEKQRGVAVETVARALQQPKNRPASWTTGAKARRVADRVRELRDIGDKLREIGPMQLKAAIAQVIDEEKELGGPGLSRRYVFAALKRWPPYHERAKK